MEDPEGPNRILAILGNNGGWDNAPLVVLTVVCVVFCLIWTPMIFRCRRPHAAWLQTTLDAANDTDNDALRVSIENLRRLASETGITGRGSFVTRRSHPLHHLSPDDRKAFLNNVLITRKIISVSKEGPAVHYVESDDGLTCKSCHGGAKTTLVLADVIDTESTTKLVEVEPCSICLNDYTEGDILCWSQNSECQHAFHKDCAMEWLMQSTKCPLCRSNYLSLDGEDELSPQDNVDDNDALPILTIPAVLRMINNVPADDTVTFLRSMHLLYLLSQLQATSDSPTENPPQWQGIELTTGSFRTGRIQEEPTISVGGEPGSERQLNSFDESESTTRVGSTSAGNEADDEPV